MLCTRLRPNSEATPTHLLVIIEVLCNAIGAGGIWVVLRKGVPWGVTVFETITHLLSMKSLNVDDFHVSVAINI